MADTKTSAAPLDRRFEAQLASLLRAGVILAATVVLIGGAIYLAKYHGETPDYRVFRGEPAQYRTFTGVWRTAIALEGRGFIQLGLLLLIATPIARVLVSVFDFARERDWLYVGVTLFVLAVLIYSLMSPG
jgi:uncharacterized membrane protein